MNFESINNRDENMIFQDRREAGIKLAQALGKFHGQDVIILALPRGGVVLGAEIAKQLHAPLDLVLTKKIGHPLNPEYAICAMAEGGEPICNTLEVSMVDQEWFQNEIKRTQAELARRRSEYLGDAAPREVKGKIAIIVDDGIATGYTMMAALEELKRRGAKKVVVAIPVTPADTAPHLEKMGAELISLKVDPYYLGAVGAYYLDFDQVSDSEVISLLKSVNAAKLP
jgi:predicted phosphoribosyltransferase